MLQDGQPSTRQLLNSSQAIVSAYTTDAFGNNLSSTGTAANPFKWNGGSGYYSDSESGLQKVGARYYDPSVGSWISQDTMLIAGSPADSQAVNRYLYCGANPVGRADAGGHGLEWVVVFVLIVLVILGVYVLCTIAVGHYGPPPPSVTNPVDPTHPTGGSGAPGGTGGNLGAPPLPNPQPIPPQPVPPDRLWGPLGPE